MKFQAVVQRVSKYYIYTFSLFLSSITLADFVDSYGYSWKDVSLYTGYSYDELASVCPTDGNVCQGFLGSSNISGLVWATEQQVQQLVSEFFIAIDAEASPTFIDDDGSVQDLALENFMSAFNPTLTEYPTSQAVWGWTSSTVSNSAGKAVSFMIQDDIVFNDGAYTGIAVGWHWNKSDSTNYNGAWLFSSMPAIPLPGAVWLFGSAVVGLFGYRKASDIDHPIPCHPLWPQFPRPTESSNHPESDGQSPKV